MQWTKDFLLHDKNEDGEDVNHPSFHSLSQVHLIVTSLKSLLLQSCGGSQAKLENLVHMNLPLYVDSAEVHRSVVNEVAIPLSTADKKNPLEINTETNKMVLPASKTTSFDEFKVTEEGLRLNSIYEKSKVALFVNKLNQRKLVDSINLTKQNIDGMSGQHQKYIELQFTLQKDQGADKVSLPSEELVKLKEGLATLKAAYREGLTQLNELKIDQPNLQRAKESALSSLLNTYEQLHKQV